MTTTKMKIVKETEKAILFTIAFKYDSFAESIIFGEPGNQQCEPGRLIDAWIPKSIIGEDGSIPGWFCVKIRKQFGLNEMKGDVIF